MRAQLRANRHRRGVERRLGERLGGVELGKPHELAQHRLLPLDEAGDELVDHRWVCTGRASATAARVQAMFEYFYVSVNKPRDWLGVTRVFQVASLR